MIGTITSLKTDGSTTTLDIETDDTNDILNILRSVVGGFIEVVPYFTTYKDKPCIAFCNEEGKLRGNYRLNVPATHAWTSAQLRQGVRVDDVLVGNIAIVTGDELLKVL